MVPVNLYRHCCRPVSLFRLERQFPATFVSKKQDYDSTSATAIQRARDPRLHTRVSRHRCLTRGRCQRWRAFHSACPNYISMNAMGRRAPVTYHLDSGKRGNPQVSGQLGKVPARTREGDKWRPRNPSTPERLKEISPHHDTSKPPALCTVKVA